MRMVFVHMVFVGCCNEEAAKDRFRDANPLLIFCHVPVVTPCATKAAESHTAQ